MKEPSGKPITFEYFRPEFAGVRLCCGGAELSADLPPGAAAELVLTDHDGEELLVIPLPEEKRSGRLSGVRLTAEDLSSVFYYYRVCGRTYRDPGALALRGDLAYFPGICLCAGRPSQKSFRPCFL